MPSKYLSGAAKREANKDKTMQNAQLTKITAFGFVSTNATKTGTTITTTELHSMDKSNEAVETEEVACAKNLSNVDCTVSDCDNVIVNEIIEVGEAEAAVITESRIKEYQ